MSARVKATDYISNLTKHTCVLSSLLPMQLIESLGIALETQTMLLGTLNKVMLENEINWKGGSSWIFAFLLLSIIHPTSSSHYYFIPLKLLCVTMHFIAFKTFSDFFPSFPIKNMHYYWYPLRCVIVLKSSFEYLFNPLFQCICV